MSAQGFGVVTTVLPEDPNQRGRFGVVNETLGFEYQGSDSIRTLSSNNPNGLDVVAGLLYVPDIGGFRNGCDNATLSLIPTNVTTRSDLPPDGYDFIAIAPWTEPACVQSFLSLMRAEAVNAAIFFQNDTSENIPPTVSDRVWALNDGGQWRQENQYPIYAVPGQTGTLLLEQLAQYSGNMSAAPFGDQLVQVYDPADDVRLSARISIQSTTGIPSLWIFLIIVLAILLAVVLATSVLMHFIQRRRRILLSRRVARGEVDLEALGIKRLNVPQDLLDKMPQYLYTSKAENIPVAAKTAIREVPFTQPTCPICLDDFIHGETTVRELPCNHIFHPECIDPFLRDNSSLCPMCKKSALPAGYCPVSVTNLMVRRERLIRRMRARNGGEEFVSSNPLVGAVQRRIRTLSMPHGNYGMHSSRVSGHGADNGGAEMTNVTSSVSRPEPVHITGEQTQHQSESRGANAEEVPAEIAAQGTAARRAYLREQVARRQQEQFQETAQEARDVDVRRPLWRRIGGRFFTRLE